MKVFIVEDSPDICERLIEMIDGVDGNTVVGHAETYDEAVAGIARSEPDVAIFDIKLGQGSGPQGSGLDALVESRRWLPGLRGIVMSNHTTSQHRKASADAGAEYFLDKSADFEQLPHILSSLKNRPAVGESR